MKRARPQAEHAKLSRFKGGMNPLPQPGMFIREVKGYSTFYCLEVIRVLDCDDTHGPGIKHITAKRWGVDDDGQPLDDGHTNESYYCDRIRPVREKAWRFLGGQPWDCKPMYWRQIDIKPKAQQELFQ